MQNRTKRLFSVILALCLALTTLSMMVTADTSPSHTIPGGICGTAFEPFQTPIGESGSPESYDYTWKNKSGNEWLELNTAGMITAVGGKFPNTPQEETAVTVAVSHMTNSSLPNNVILTVGAVIASGTLKGDGISNVTAELTNTDITSDGWALTLTPKEGFFWKTTPTISVTGNVTASTAKNYAENTSNAVTFTFSKASANFDVELKGGAVEQQQYAVTFDSNDGTTTIPSQTVKHGETPLPPDTPQRDGFLFRGWFTAKTGGTRVTDWNAQKITAPVTYYAQWLDATSGVTIQVDNKTGSPFASAPTVTIGDKTVVVEESVTPNLYTGVGTISIGSHQMMITYEVDSVTKKIAQIVDITSANQVQEISLIPMGKNGITINTTQPILIDAHQNVQSNGAAVDRLDISITPSVATDDSTEELQTLAKNTFYAFNKGILLDITINNEAVTSTTHPITYQYSLGDGYKGEDIALFTKHGETAEKIPSSIKTTPDGKKAVVFSTDKYSSFYVAYGTLVDPALAVPAPSVVTGTSRSGSSSSGYVPASSSVPLRGTAVGQPALVPVTDIKSPAETGR